MPHLCHVFSGSLGPISLGPINEPPKGTPVRSVTSERTVNYENTCANLPVWPPEPSFIMSQKYASEFRNLALKNKIYFRWSVAVWLCCGFSR